CEAIGRDPSTIVVSAMVGTLVGETDAELSRRVDDQVMAFAQDPADTAAWLTERENRWIVGTPDVARARLADYEAAGMDRVMLQIFLPRDLEMVALLGRMFVR
ncbi:MAG: hypothetical protein ABIZ34_08695, partial [Candidatus Limnocylindrales bacterium]